MDKLLRRATQIYNYVLQKKSVTHMRVAPKQNLVEKNLRGLGFKLQKEGKKGCKIEVADFKGQNLLLLAYYSMPLVGVFLLEGCLAQII